MLNDGFIDDSNYLKERAEQIKKTPGFVLAGELSYVNVDSEPVILLHHFDPYKLIMGEGKPGRIFFLNKNSPTVESKIVDYRYTVNQGEKQIVIYDFFLYGKGIEEATIDLLLKHAENNGISSIIVRFAQHIEDNQLNKLRSFLLDFGFNIRNNEARRRL